MAPEFRRHEIEWTDEKVARHWDYASSNPEYEDSYFSKVVGDLVLDEVRRIVPLEGRILDFGCGPGHLMEKLIARGVAVRGVDFSEDSIASVNARLSGNPLFRGAVHITGLPVKELDGSYDIVFLLETIEHILPEIMNATLSELNRLLRIGGKIVITTPNRENLEANKVMCPECGCTFHRIQHVHSWSAESLSATMARFGFQRVRTVETTFRRGDVLNNLYRLYFRLSGRTRPNLIYVGEKTAPSSSHQSEPGA